MLLPLLLAAACGGGDEEETGGGASGQGTKVVKIGVIAPLSGDLTATGASRVVLVSCDPASLARDCVLLREAGYALVSVLLVDAFPHTFHVETVSRFDLVTTTP